jgi:hypothetical protein
MPNFEQDEFKFPDEIDDKDDVVNLDEGGKTEVEDKGFDIEVEDDTPEKDRNAVPLDKDTVKELEEDDLKDYSKKVKQRIDQMKKVWHDERRRADAAEREQQEAVRVAQQLLDENKKLKEAYSSGEKTYIEVAQGAAESQLQLAKRSYKEALDSGDSDAIADAQVALNEASYKSQQSKNFRPTTLQADEKDVQIPQSTYKEQPKIDPTTQKWLDKNTWYGADEEMTALALAVHSKLENNFGKQFVGSEDYFKRIDNTIRKRFPENFSDEVEIQTQTGGGKPSQRTEAKSAPVVAPATRSTASKRIVLKATQVALAKKLGLSPEQYARELQKLEG